LGDFISPTARQQQKFDGAGGNSVLVGIQRL